MMQKKAWEEHLKDYHVLEDDGWGGFNYYTFPDFLKENDSIIARIKRERRKEKYINQNKK